MEEKLSARSQTLLCNMAQPHSSADDSQRSCMLLDIQSLACGGCTTAKSYANMEIQASNSSCACGFCFDTVT